MIERAAILVLALGSACGSRDREPAAPVRNDGVAAVDALALQGGTMIDLVHEVVRFAAADRLTVDRAVAKFGPLGHDEGPHSPLHLQPRDARFRDVAVSRRFDTGDPYTLDVQLATAIRLRDLETAFGTFKQTRTDWDVPRELVSPRIDVGGPFTVGLIVHVDRGVDLAAAEVTAFTVLPEPRGDTP